jgi:hypothetical protein
MFSSLTKDLIGWPLIQRVIIVIDDNARGVAKLEPGDLLTGEETAPLLRLTSRALCGSRIARSRGLTRSALAGSLATLRSRMWLVPRQFARSSNEERGTGRSPDR